MMPPNPALQPTVLAFGVALPSQRCALFGAAELDRWAAGNQMYIGLSSDVVQCGQRNLHQRSSLVGIGRQPSALLVHSSWNRNFRSRARNTMALHVHTPRATRPNHAFKPTVHAFGAPVGANGVHFPRRATRRLGAA